MSGGGLADIAPSAPVTISDSQFTGNSTSAGPDIAINNGGGAKLAGPSTVSRTTFNGNSVSGGDAGTGPSGGGLYVQSGTTDLVNVTISSNLATTTGGDGGGVDTGLGSGAVNFDNVTSAGNDADEEGDGIQAAGRTADLRASLIDDGCGGGSIIDSGGNVESGDTCGLSDGSSSAIAVGPLLGNGGAAIGVPGSLQPRLTRAIPMESAALDHVTERMRGPARRCPRHGRPRPAPPARRRRRRLSGLRRGRLRARGVRPPAPAGGRTSARGTTSSPWLKCVLKKIKDHHKGHGHGHGHHGSTAASRPPRSASGRPRRRRGPAAS